MRLLWASNFSSQSAYAIQARLFVPQIQAAGHNVTVLELANGTRLPQMIGGVQVLPVGLDPLGSDTLIAHSQQIQAHAVITLVDAWGMQASVMQHVSWYPWTPIDTLPVIPAVAEALKACKRPIAMTRYGERELRKIGLDPLYVPHAVDPDIWYPRDKAQARQALNIAQDVFFVAFVGVNDSVPSRKGIPELLMAWQTFEAQHPNTRLYMHTSVQGNLAVNTFGGVRIDQLCKTFGLQQVQMVDQYRYRTGIPASELAQIAAAADVLILPSRGEGFGLPLIEFQRVGTPVITTDFAAGSELCFGGWHIDGEPEWSPHGAVVRKPGIAAIYEALEAAYNDRDNPARRARAIEGAREYDIENVMARHMLPTLRTITEQVLDSIQVA